MALKKAILILFLALPCFVLAQTKPKDQPSHAPSSGVQPRKGVSTESTWSFLSLEACGIETFLKKYPTADGRGTIVAILDDGVDPGLAGLLKTSEGKVKIIDVQDFSGTGDLYWTTAARSGNKLTAENQEVLRGLDNVKAHNDLYYYARLEEKRFQNGLGDLNFNAQEDDVFGVIVFEDMPGHWSAVVDGDADGDVSNEPILSNYRERQNLFRFRESASDTLGDSRFLSGAINIFPNEKRINLYFADGGHGTHVAGMAAGHEIGGQRGFNGVAPGAEVVAIKFSDNTQSGITVSGSMKAAYEYVVRVARETGKPVVANMSFGIGSEIEGQSAMDLWLDSLLDANPDVVVCISGSNDGPGLSNIGLPGSARTAITSGAALPDDTGRDLYGVSMSKPVIWDFSSRGGELAKPDIVSPGTAISTVPDYVLHDRYNGTSMASPFTAGCCAVLISAMQQQFPGYKPDAYLMKRALQLGAKPLSGYTPLDQGAGMINVPRAYEYLSGWHRKGNAPREYIIEAHVPGSLRRATSAYYRSGVFPRGGERTAFHIRPISVKGRKTRDEVLSFNAFTLRSDASWLEPVQSSIYRRGLGQLEVDVRYDEKQLKQPGLYVGKILGYPKGIISDVPEFELWNTIVIPHLLEESNDFKYYQRNITMRAGELRREFFKVPSGIAALKFTIDRQSTKGISATLFDNDGRSFSGMNLPKDRTVATRVISGDDIPSGVIELVLRSGIGNDDDEDALFDLTVEAFPIVMKNVVTEVKPSGDAKAIMNFTNSGNKHYDLEFSGTVEGYERVIDTLVTNTDEFRYPFHFHGNEESVSFDIELSRKDYNLFTDISLQVIKPNGEAVASTAFDERRARVIYKRIAEDSSTYTVYFRGGLALPGRGDSFRLLIRERREFISEPELRAAPLSLGLDAAQSEQVRLSSVRGLPDIPSGYRYYGDVQAKLKGAEKIVYPLSFAK